jgi:GNAT superfamily N-acetyltransferase
MARARVLGNRLLWAKRFAVCSSYQRTGVGTALAKAVIEVARERVLPRPIGIEVITAGPESFLERAGYTQASIVTRGYRRTKGNGEYYRKPAKNYYYYFPLQVRR